MYSMQGAPTAWLPYIGVEDLKASTDKAISLGAKVLMREQEVPGHGWFSMLVDPTGASIALWQAKQA
jgi:predicted enzyme related to lactoylglutathione lyase